MSTTNKAANVKYIANKASIQSKLRANNFYSHREIMQDVKQEVAGVEVNYVTAWRAKQIFVGLRNSTFTVDFNSKKCSCNGWQNDGYPCTRSLAVYLKKHVVPFDGIAEIHINLYSLEYYKKSYETSIPIVADRSEWEFKSKFQTVDPPSVSKVGGRPRKKRIDTFSQQRKRQRVALVQDDWLSLFQEDNVPELIDVDDVYPDSDMENHFDLLNDDVA
ncbi:hypothetical protein P9112_000010 [Eukaryota sp. TZLM1-RC]